jgi:hypothetical protein
MGALIDAAAPSTYRAPVTDKTEPFFPFDFLLSPAAPSPPSFADALAEGRLRLASSRAEELAADAAIGAILLELGEAVRPLAVQLRSVCRLGGTVRPAPDGAEGSWRVIAIESPHGGPRGSTPTAGILLLGLDGLTRERVLERLADPEVCAGIGRELADHEEVEAQLAAAERTREARALAAEAAKPSERSRRLRLAAKDGYWGLSASSVACVALYGSDPMWVAVLCCALACAGLSRLLPARS